MKYLHLDFETRSQVDLKTRGTYNYATDPSTSVLCLAYALDDAPVVALGREEVLTKGCELLRAYALDPNVIFCAHNAAFERYILQYVLDIPPIPLDRWECTMAMAYQVGLPGTLDHLAKALKLKVLKDLEGQKVMRRLSNGKLPLPEGDKWVAEERRLMDYCITDVEVERIAHTKMPPLPPQEKILWALDQTINDRGMRVAIEFVAAAVNSREEVREALEGQLTEVTKGQVTSGSEVAKMKAFLASFGTVLPDLTKATVAHHLALPDLPATCRQVLELRQALSASATAKYVKVLDQVCADNRVRGYLQYHGAFTGRWSGRAIQPQNLPKPTLLPEIIGEAFARVSQEGVVKVAEDLGVSVDGLLKSCLRGVFLPEEDETLVMIDYASIEARGVMWLAKCERGLTQFANKDDLYVEMAKVIFKDPNLTKENKDERQLGKQAVLGCGYGMGAVKFYETCVSYNVPNITEPLSQAAVYAYREYYPEVPKLWKGLEKATIQAMVSKKPTAFNGVVYETKGTVLTCTLPSGRKLWYIHPKLIDRGGRFELTYQKVKQGSPTLLRTSTWGGKLTENVVQAIARDIMAEALVKLSAIPGVTLLLTIHDEIVMSIKKGVSIEKLGYIMREVPWWAKGFPLGIDVTEGVRYGK